MFMNFLSKRKKKKTKGEGERPERERDRKSGGWGERVDLCGRRNIKNKKTD